MKFFEDADLCTWQPEESDVKFEVSISDPTKQGSGYQAFVSYKVTLQVNRTYEEGA